jgi:hypothetical protein
VTGGARRDHRELNAISRRSRARRLGGLGLSDLVGVEHKRAGFELEEGVGAGGTGHRTFEADVIG